MARLLAAHLMLFSLLTPAVAQDGTAAKSPPTIQIDVSDLKVPDGDVTVEVAEFVGDAAEYRISVAKKNGEAESLELVRKSPALPKTRRG
jgi:hypothetical protein